MTTDETKVEINRLPGSFHSKDVVLGVDFPLSSLALWLAEIRSRSDGYTNLKMRSHVRAIEVRKTVSRVHEKLCLHWD